MGQASPDPTRRRRRRIVGWTITGLLVVLVGVGVWVASRVLVVQAELSAVTALRASAEKALADADIEAMTGIVGDVQERVATAEAAASDPLWRVAEVVPGLGPNLHAVRVVTEQVDLVVTDAAAPVATLLADLSAGDLMSDGAVNVALLETAADPLREADAVLTNAGTEIEKISRDGLVGEVAAGVDDATRLVSQLGAAVSGMADVTDVLPRMLGAESPRRILVMMQNNAELRSGGGITGSFAEIIADGGRIEMTRQADSSEFRRAPHDLLEVPESTTALYGDIVGRYVQNTTTTPDFDLSARLASSWWEGLTGDRPDLVVSIDPLVLRALLAVTGPVTLASGEELVHEKFVSDVLVAPYLHRDADEQTAFFQDLTDRFFQSVLQTSAAPTEWISALRTPIDQGRISVWSSFEDEADVLAHSPFAGALARHRDAGADAFMVYLNDSTGAKMDSRLAVDMGVVSGSCRADGRAEVAVQVRLENEAPSDAGTKWPLSMTGGGHWGVAPGHIATSIAVAAPAGWFAGGTTVDGARVTTVDVEDGGFPTSATEVDVAPGKVALVEVRFVAPDLDEVSPHLLHTPLLRAAGEIGLRELSCD